MKSSDYESAGYEIYRFTNAQLLLLMNNCKLNYEMHELNYETK